MPRPLSFLALLAPLLVMLGCNKAPASTAADGRPEIAISVDAVGYHPAESHANGGSEVHLVFTRTSEDGCGQEVVIPSANVKRGLPLNKPVSIDVTMPAKGSLAFACGMDMMHGSVKAD
jgi:Cu+-exporting ATPase